MKPEPLAYRVPDACAALGIGRTLLYRLIAEGKIEARAIAGRTIIPAASVNAFLAALPNAPITKSAT
ncbi:helix-turn-helix domain-containing protein [Acidithiobacillus sp.]|uniref:helix-turn-helix domain-containing protein n=1 Tax=Acidithiobacillus sp. TaxID=1872118 RepID=UPI003CFFB6C3